MPQRGRSESEQLHCARCGRFLGEDCLQGVDWSRGSMHIEDGDWPWTEDYFCAHGVGCNRDEAWEALEEEAALEAAGMDVYGSLQ